MQLRPRRQSQQPQRLVNQDCDGPGLADFEELYSRVGAGGGLTRQGALDAIRFMNRKREVLRKVEALMEGGEAELVEGIVEMLYRKVVDGEA